MTDFAERLRTARENAGFKTATDASKRLGLEAHTYRHYERGDRNPPLDALPDMARAFGVRLEWLLTGKGSADTAEIINFWDRVLEKDRPAALRMLQGLTQPQ